MTIKIVIDKQYEGTLYVFLRDSDITRFIFRRNPKDVVNVKILPGETSRSILRDDDEYLILSIESDFEPADYIQYGNKVEEYLEK